MLLWQPKSLSPLLLCLLLACNTTTGRHVGRRRSKERLQLKKVVPLLRAVDSADGISGTTTAADADVDADFNEESKVPPKKLLLMKPATGEARVASRTFKHLLIAKGLLGGGGCCGGGGGGGGGSGGGGWGGGGGGGGTSNYMVPYIIINTPTNVTNVNDNQLNNSPTAPATTTPTTTAAGGNQVWINRAQTLPVALPMQLQRPTPVHQQRKNNAPQQMAPASAAIMPAMMLGFNDQFIPVFAPPQLQHFGAGGSRRRHNNNNNGNNNNSGYNNNNPFVMLANNLKGIQYL